MALDRNDIVQLLKDVLPTGWFAGETPVLDRLLSGLSETWLLIHDNIQYVRGQTRVATASDIWLDAIAADFFGPRVVRRYNQTDDSFRTQISSELFRERGTRGAVSKALEDLTGRIPIIFEPAHCGDTGAYGSLGMPGSLVSFGCGYGMAGGWGNLNLPFQFMVTAYRPLRETMASTVGWGAGGLNMGYSSYSTLEVARGSITDADINNTVSAVLPVSTVGWARIVG